MPEAPTRLETPFSEEAARGLRAGDRVLLSGTIYGMRDAAHKRVVEMLGRGENLPFEIEGAVIYYVGPAPAKDGWIIGPAGPTTSSRMDAYTPALTERGARGSIGKGKRDAAVRDSLAEHGAVYFHAVGGAAALIAACIKEVSVIAFEDLGTEAVRRIRVEDMPLTVANDSEGGDVYEIGRARHRRN